MARNHLEKRLEDIRNQKSMYKLRIRRLEKEEIKILEELGVFKKRGGNRMNDSGFLTEVKEYRKKPVAVTAYQTDKEFDIPTPEGVMTASVGDFIITGVAGEQYPCKPDIFFATYDVEDTSISDDVMTNISEWSSLVTELSSKEIDLFHKKEAYNALSEEIIASTNFKTLYGKNNESIRKQHVKGTLVDEYKEIKDLKFSIDYISRRISYLKSLIHTKNVLREVKE